jgi:predicted AAA+ superfamily ATPase
MNNIYIPEKLINRQGYTSQIEPFIGKPVIKVFTGQRRTGKSYMLFQVMEIVKERDKKANIIYINKEDLKFDDIKEHTALSKLILSLSVPAKMNYIFIDEIQEIAGFEKCVRSLLLKKNNDIYITGSNATLLSGELATTLGGRTIEIRVYSLSYSEFLVFHSLPDSDETLSKYFLFGGLPFIVNLEMSEEIVSEYLKNILNTIIYRDVVLRHNIRSTNFLERLVRFLADNTGSIFSSKKISDYLKSQKTNIPHNQVQTFADYLANAFLIHKVERYDISGKRFFEVGEKYYFENTGIRNSASGYKPGDDGKILENVVYNELISRGYVVKTGWHEKHEIDFVASKNNETVYLQVALKVENRETIDREFGNLLKIEDNYPKYVITADNQYKNTVEGVEHVNIRRFLTGNVRGERFRV